MTNRELEIIGSLLRRANPPPMLYRYRRPNEYTLKEISEFQLYVAAPNDLNDPFESGAQVKIDDKKLRDSFIDFCVKNGRNTAIGAAAEFDRTAIARTATSLTRFIDERRQRSGVVCFSAVPDSIRMWSYYAESHEGICVGYRSTFGPFIAAMKVNYMNPEQPLDLMDALKTDPAILADHVSLRKAAEWEFEQEYRLCVGDFGSNPRLLPFKPEAIAEIRFGARIKEEFRQKVLDIVKRLPTRPNLIQMGCDMNRFTLTETVLSVP